MTIVIDGLKAIAMLERAVDEKGAKYIDGLALSGMSCKYVSETGEASCIVGHVVGYLDPALLSKVQWWERNEAVFYDEDDQYIEDVMNDFKSGNPGDVSVSDLAEALRAADIEFTSEAVAVFQAAQTAQDGGATWGAALEVAKARLPEFQRAYGPTPVPA